MSPCPEGYDALILVEVIATQEPLNLNAADVEAIVEITSAVDEPEQSA
jgi:RAB protein geranylgeranyltransferase component A